MRVHLILLAISAILLPKGFAEAEPVAYYFPADGTIRVSNDTGHPLANVSIVSMSGNLTTSSAMLDLPGAIKDDSEFPYALTYLNFPPGNHSFGLVAKPGLDFYTHGGFEFQYRTLTLLEPLTVGSWFFPEPASFALTGMGCLAVVAAGRKRLRRAVTSEP